jgi:hypothetical protein
MRPLGPRRTVEATGRGHAAHPATGGPWCSLWVILMILVPCIGVFAYLFIDHDEMATRSLDHMKAHRAQFAAIEEKALAA